jgi:hypothetical protein
VGRQNGGVPIRSEWLLVVLAVLAVARLSHLITTDFILDPFRAWMGRHAPSSLLILISCAWCLSWWFGFAVATAVWFRPHSWWVQIPLIGLAASYLTGIFEQSSGLINAEHDLAEQQAEDT